MHIATYNSYVLTSDSSYNNATIRPQISVAILICWIPELYVKYGKDQPDFNGTHCLTDIMIEDFINAMSVLYHKGHFILGAEMEDNFNFALYPDVGTEMGICKTIKPMVRSHKHEMVRNCIILSQKHHWLTWVGGLRTDKPEKNMSWYMLGLSGGFSARAAHPEGEGRQQDQAGGQRVQRPPQWADCLGGCGDLGLRLYSSHRWRSEIDSWTFF